MMKFCHPYHLVNMSPWPLVGIFGASFLTIGLVNWFHHLAFQLILLGTALILFTMFQWWRDTAREGSLQGLHTLKVQTGLKWGMILFITSEVMFFFSFFWAFFHSSLSPAFELGVLWPPAGILPLGFMEVPLLNTTVLLTSGMTVTWAHHSLVESAHQQALLGLTMTALLGFYFSLLQGLEYYEATFALSDSVYGSTFFVATGFHGAHVIIGSIFLLVCTIRLSIGHFSPTHHFGLEAAAWYWHFVDIVWLFLYSVVYWWGSLL